MDKFYQTGSIVEVPLIFAFVGEFLPVLNVLFSEELVLVLHVARAVINFSYCFVVMTEFWCLNLIFMGIACYWLNILPPPNQQH